MAKGTVDLAAESRSPAPNSVTHSRLSVAAMGRIPETPPGGADGLTWQRREDRRQNLTTRTVSDCGGHYADFGRGRYSVARTYGWVQRFVARWHRSRDPFTQGQNITGAPCGAIATPKIFQND
jgi:hypothetical protein